VAIIAYHANKGVSALAEALRGDTASGIHSCPGYPNAANHAASLIARIIDVSHTMVLHLEPDGDHLLVQDGVGWKSGTVGHPLLETGESTFASVALSSDSPLIMHDLNTETRFSIPAIFSEHGVVSGLCSRILYDNDAVGVLAVFSTELRSFGKYEIACLDAVAEMLSLTMGCMLIEEACHKEKERKEQAEQNWEAIVDILPHFICSLDERGRILHANRSLELWMPEIIRDIRGQKIHDLLHPNCRNDTCYLRNLIGEKWQDVMNANHVVFEVNDLTLKRQFEIQLRPIMRRSPVKSSSASLAVMVMHDITRIKHEVETLKTCKKELENLVKVRTNELVRVNEQLWSEILIRRRQEDELRKSEDDMRLLSAQLLTAQEMERKRIAAELHDGISQSLMAIKFAIENAADHGLIRSGAKHDDMIKSIFDRIQMAIDEVHRISLNLRPSMLDDLGIIPTIGWFCRDFRAVYQYINLVTSIDIDESDVSDALKTVVYRILQESLNNIAKHAMAKNVSVHLIRHASSIEFSVQDDGIGFDLEQFGLCGSTRTGSGLANMRERVEFSGGSFSINSEQAVGTVIRAIWPYSQ